VRGKSHRYRVDGSLSPDEIVPGRRRSSRHIRVDRSRLKVIHRVVCGNRYSRRMGLSFRLGTRVYSSLSTIQQVFPRVPVARPHPIHAPTRRLGFTGTGQTCSQADPISIPLSIQSLPLVSSPRDLGTTQGQNSPIPDAPNRMFSRPLDPRYGHIPTSSRPPHARHTSTSSAPKTQRKCQTQDQDHQVEPGGDSHRPTVLNASINVDHEFQPALSSVVSRVATRSERRR
jgi:hypothetical protein